MDKTISESKPFPFADADDASVFTSVNLEDPEQPAGADQKQKPSSTPAPEPTGPASYADIPPVALVTVDRPAIEPTDYDVRPPRCVIGAGEADVILEDEFVSDWHAQLYLDGGNLVLEDMTSYNGVFLRIANELTLEDRDELVMGQQRFVFRSAWEDPTTADRPDRDRNVQRLGAPMAGSPVRLERILEGGRVSEIYPIGDRLTIGNDGCSVNCPEDLSLSSPHAEIVRDGETFYLSDLQSDYGTYIRIHNPVELVDGDSFVIGRTRLNLSYL